MTIIFLAVQSDESLDSLISEIEHSTFIEQWVIKPTFTIRGYLLPMQVTFSRSPTIYR